MLLAALLFCYAWLVTCIAGHAAISWVEKFSNEPVAFKHTPLVHVAGMAVIAAFVSMLHLFFPVAATVHLAVLSAVVVYALCVRTNLVHFLRSYIRQSLMDRWITGMLLLVAIISITAKPGTGDIADYHLQAIKWAEFYPNIPGLGNFNKPLANNYWWFNLQAFFGLGFAGVPSVYCLNALLYFSVTLFIYQNFRHSSFKIFYFILLLFMVFSIKTAFIGAVTTDVFINDIIFVLFALILSDRFSTSQYYLFLLLLAFSVTVKITIIMSGALWLYATISHWQLHKRDIKTTLKWHGWLMLLFALPWIAGNIVQSGYIIPLFNHIDILDVDWKVPGKYFDLERMVITNWSKLPDQNMYVTSQMTLWEWVPRWFMMHDWFNRGLILLAGFSLCISGALWFRATRSKNINHHLLVTTCAVAGLLFMFFSSPQMRFMFGYAVVVPGLVLQLILPFNNEWMKGAVAIIFVAILGLSGLRVLSMHKQYALQTILLVPPKYPDGLVEPVQWGNNILYVTKQNNTCWDTFPCSYYVLPNTVLRGTTISEGFRNTELKRD